jgi:alanine racemase
MSSRLRVSLSAIAANYQRLRRSARAEVAAVVKADAYGLGASRIASLLASDGCREFFVATVAEGVKLRQTLRDATIYVLEGAYTESVAALVQERLIPILNTADQCAVWKTTGRSAGIHIDTGMQRLGFSHWESLNSVINLPFAICLLVTHFACADEAENSTISCQLERIGSICSALKERHPSLRLSVCNSAALLQSLGPEDVGRAGIALYGGNPFCGRANPMAAAVQLEARLMQIREVPPNAAVGYGGSFVTERKTRLAVVGLGYADGLPRSLSNTGAIVVNGSVCPIVGRVSMDMTTVDVTGVSASEGDWVEVIGPNLSVDAVATRAGTLAYEILTGIGPRVPRAYAEL